MIGQPFTTHGIGSYSTHTKVLVSEQANAIGAMQRISRVMDFQHTRCIIQAEIRSIIPACERFHPCPESEDSKPLEP
jgi:hypothetical protein